ncbi:MAG: hypothetical protein M0D57_15740 [Sphingobacteriales bacterium JAD_PAG50586_3]|nr:MAG: hypothetical protein M0D57_15740 [Sphingobacteriales bacterium JAD_PAG50586_3]
MSNFITRIFSKFLGNKNESDLKLITPVVGQVATAYEVISKLSNDELRGKTAEFKQRIAKHIEAETTEIAAMRSQIEERPDMDIEEKERLFVEIDRLEKDKYKKFRKCWAIFCPKPFR